MHHRQYNFEAQRAADVLVKPSPAIQDRSLEWIGERGVAEWKRLLYQVPKTPPKVQPRVINVLLTSDNKASVGDNEMSWYVDLGHVWSLAPGTVVYWRNLYANLPGNCEFALSGFNSTSYALSGFQYALRAFFVENGTGNFVTSPVTPLCVTVLDPEMLKGSRLTLHRLGYTGASTFVASNPTIRVSLVFVEPGAAF